MPGNLGRIAVVVLLAAGPAGAQSLRPGALPVVVHPAGLPDRDGARSRRAQNGHFYFRTEVNGAALPMMFDSGASMVALRYEDAAAVGVDLGSLRFSVPTNTANGVAMSAAVVIRELTVGGITKTGVRAMVAKPGVLVENLLGQSFLVRLGGFRQEGDQLVLFDSQ